MTVKKEERDPEIFIPEEERKAITYKVYVNEQDRETTYTEVNSSSSSALGKVHGLIILLIASGKGITKKFVIGRVGRKVGTGSLINRGPARREYG